MLWHTYKKLTRKWRPKVNKTKTAKPICTNANLFIEKKKNRKLAYLRPSLPLNAKNCYGLFEVLWRGLAGGCHSKNVTLKCNSFISLQKVYTFLGYSTLIYTSMQFLHTQLILINTVPVEHC